MIAAAMEAIAWTGNLCLAVCAIPQAIKSWRTGTSAGVDNSFISLWSAGEILVLVYVIYIQEFALMMNFVANVFSLVVIWKFKIWPRSTAAVVEQD